MNKNLALQSTRKTTNRKDKMTRPDIETGPWKIDRPRAGVVWIDSKDGQASICTFNYDAEDAPFVDAHAKFIAAAPQMAEALETALGTLERAELFGHEAGLIREALTAAGYTFP